MHAVGGGMKNDTEMVRRGLITRLLQKGGKRKLTALSSINGKQNNYTMSARWSELNIRVHSSMKC